MPHILGQRILLREYRLSDLPEMRKWVNDPRVTRGLSDIFLFPHSQEATEEFLRDVLEGRSDTREFVVASRPSEAYLGQIGLKVLDWKNRFAEISLVFPREHQGQGYGTEAIGLLQRFAFEEMGLNRLELFVHEDNAPALRCYQKCGFREEGRFRQRFFRQGRFWDMILMALLAEEYRSFPAPAEEREDFV